MPNVSVHFSNHFRVYPVRFGRKVCELMPKLMTKGEGQPSLSPSRVAAHEALAETEWSDWPEANLAGALRYMWGNKSLQLPQEWRAAFPRAL